MHVADGILPVGACLAAHAVALAGVWGSGRDVQAHEVVRMGLLSSLTFVVSLIHFPLAGTSVHLGLFGLSGMILGWRSFPVLYATLLFQALAFGHGGLLTLGVNAINMGSGTLLAAALWRLPAGAETVKAFAAGFVGILIPAALIALEFETAGYGRGVWFIGTVYLAAATIEGLLTVTVASFLRRVKPAVLARADA